MNHTMKITTQKQYTVWVRPIGSTVWTINMKPAPIWSDRRLANNLASTIASKTRQCAVVRELSFLKEADAVDEPYIEILDPEGVPERYLRDTFWIPEAEQDRDTLGGSNHE